MTLQGKGMMIWKIPNCEGGDAQKIGIAAKAAGFSHVLIKIANDTRPYNLDSTGKDLIPPVVDAIRANGIQVWGWHYVYGYDPIGEAKIAVSQTKKYNLDGYVIDAEVEYKLAGRDSVARTFMTELRKGLPTKPIALCSFRWPTYHPTFPFSAFLEKCDLNMPQVYWMQAHNPIYDLTRTVTEFKAVQPFRPITPTGPAFSESGWTPQENEVRDFLTTAKSLGLTAANFYSWDASKTKLPQLWNTIANFNWPAPSTPTPANDPLSKIFAAMNTRNYDQFLDIYDSNAVLVTADQTIQGNANIRMRYGQLLTNVLNDGVFTIKSKEENGNTIHFTWSCQSSRGNVNDGADTLGIQDGKVMYHYSHFNVI